MTAVAPTMVRMTRPAKSIPMSREQVGSLIERLGALRKSIAEHDAQCEEDIAQIKAFHAATVGELHAEAAAIVDLVQYYCEAHRLNLTMGGRVKTVKFPAGSIGWRKRPASVEITDADAALIEAVMKGLTQFVRTKRSIDKDAMLKEPELAAQVVGVTIRPGDEEFVVKTTV